MCVTPLAPEQMGREGDTVGGPPGLYPRTDTPPPPPRPPPPPPSSSTSSVCAFSLSLSRSLSLARSLALLRACAFSLSLASCHACFFSLCLSRSLVGSLSHALSLPFSLSLSPLSEAERDAHRGPITLTYSLSHTHVYNTQLYVVLGEREKEQDACVDAFLIVSDISHCEHSLFRERHTLTPRFSSLEPLSPTPSPPSLPPSLSLPAPCLLPLSLSHTHTRSHTHAHTIHSRRWW